MKDESSPRPDTGSAQSAEVPAHLEVDPTDFIGCLLEGMAATPYEGTVELQIPPPIEPAQTMGLHRELRSIDQVESVDVRPTEQGGVVVDLVLREPTRLLEILADSPHVAKIRFRSRSALSLTLAASDL
jgi:hypothetical protein